MPTANCFDACPTEFGMLDFTQAIDGERGANQQHKWRGGERARKHQMEEKKVQTIGILLHSSVIR